MEVGDKAKRVRDLLLKSCDEWESQVKPYAKEFGEWWDEIVPGARKLYRRMQRRFLKREADKLADDGVAEVNDEWDERAEAEMKELMKRGDI